LLAAGSGCAKISDFGDTNVNPNGATAPITAALLTNIESGLGGIAFGTGTGGTRAALYAQLISETQYTDASLYQLPQLESGGFYSGALNDCQVIINQNSNPATAGNAAQSGSNANQIARTGVPLLMTLNIQDQKNQCKPMAGVHVDVWHCDKDGYYSEYGDHRLQKKDFRNAHFLRGRQTTDSKGQV
jgi:hypothetical protein